MSMIKFIIMIKSEKIKSIFAKLSGFSVTVYYSVLLFAVAGAFIFTGREVLGTYILAIIVSSTLIFSDDLLPTLEGILVICCFAIRCKNSAPEFFSMWYLGIPTVILVILRFILYKPQFRKNSFTPGMLAVSAAILLGGAGIIYWKSYFSPTSLFYMFSLGIGMVILISFVSPCLRSDRGYDFSDRFAKIHMTALFTLALSLFQEYASRFDEFSQKFSVLPFQWRNNAATILMMCMPFAFYLAAKKYSWTFAGLLDYIAILFTGSRGGLIFGTVELAICLVLILVLDKKHRKNNIILICVLSLGAILASEILFEMISYTIQRMLDPDENSIRLKLIERGFEDFKASPMVGRGLGYMGNRDIHQSAKHTLCWYHCSIVQVFASTGLIGAAAYTFLNVQRIRCFIKNLSFFAVILFTAFIGLEMMSFVNPGIFAPFPYLMLATIYFAVMENCNSKDTEGLRIMMKGKKDESSDNRE